MKSSSPDTTLVSHAKLAASTNKAQYLYPSTTSIKLKLKTVQAYRYYIRYFKFAVVQVLHSIVNKFDSNHETSLALEKQINIENSIKRLQVVIEPSFYRRFQ